MIPLLHPMKAEQLSATAWQESVGGSPESSYHSMQIFLPFHWTRPAKTAYNNGLFMRNVVQLCLAAGCISLFSFLRSVLREIIRK